MFILQDFFIGMVVSTVGSMLTLLSEAVDIAAVGLVRKVTRSRGTADVCIDI